MIENLRKNYIYFRHSKRGISLDRVTWFECIEIDDPRIIFHIFDGSGINTMVIRDYRDVSYFKTLLKDAGLDD